MLLLTLMDRVNTKHKAQFHAIYRNMLANKMSNFMFYESTSSCLGSIREVIRCQIKRIPSYFLTS